MLEALKTDKAKAVSGLNIIHLPLYFPTVTVDTLPGLSNIQSIDEIESAVNSEYANEPISNTVFVSLRKTNVIPSPSQAQALRSIRVSCEADLKGLDAEIQRLHSEISKLSLALTRITVKRLQTQNLSNSCSSLLSPLRRLPPEILGEIFIRCLPSHGRPVATAVPLLLTHVCSAWRRTALGLSSLWAHLFLTTTPSHDQAAVSLEMSNIMDLWFERASNSPLTFHLYNKYNSARERDDNVLDAMVKYAGRFRKLHVSSTSVNDIHGFVTHTPGCFERLESLQLEIGDFHEIHTTVTVFDKSPLLCEVILNVGAVDVVSHVILPWKQLTKISVVGTAIYQADMLYTLRECEQLVSGSFAITTGLGDGMIDLVFGADPIVLEYLVDLKVSLLLPRDFESSFIAVDMLSLPSLTHFTLVGDSEEDTLLSHVSLFGVLRRAPRLQNLALLNFLANREDLLQILQITPHLTFLKLALISDAEYNPLIEALKHVDGQSDVYIPLLQLLDIYVESGFDGFNLGELLAMVKLRRIASVEVPRPPVAYLNVHLRIRNGSTSDYDMLESALVKEGVERSTYNGDDNEDNSISLDLS